MVRKGSECADRGVMEAVRPYMSRRRSLRHKLRPDKAALLVIDMQGCFLDESSPSFLPDSGLIIGNVQDLIASCRQQSIPVVFTRHAHEKGEDPGTMGAWWGSVIREGTTDSMLDDRLDVQRSDKVLRKNRYSAFVGTGLERWLRARGRSQLVITGVKTHLCCETTARDAFMRGFDVFFVVDATASKTMDLHVSSIKTLTDGFAIPATTKEVLAWIGK